MISYLKPKSSEKVIQTLFGIDPIVLGATQETICIKKIDDLRMNITIKGANKIDSSVKQLLKYNKEETIDFKV